MSDAYRTDGLLIVPAGDAPKIENALESIECTIAFDVKDWSTSRRDAWIYAIVFGWSEAEEAVARTHQWDAEDIERAHRLHKQWQHIHELIDSQQLATMPRWIPVTERLPEKEDVVAFHYAGQSGTEYKEITLATLAELKCYGYKPIAWMPLPEPPKEE